MYAPRTTTGFTILELMLSVAVIAILASATLPLWTGLLWRTDVSSATDAYMSAVHEAHTYARGMKHDLGWGVRVTEASIVIYGGSDFDSRNTDYDRVVPLPDSVTFAGVTDVYFQPFSALTNDTGITTIVSQNGDEYTVAINTYGITSIQ